MKTIELVRDVECRSTPADLWRAVSDTERLNRAAGMSPVEVKPVDGPGSARVEVRTRLDGLPVTFDEEPFEWHTPSAFTVRRNMKEGALHALTMGMEILPLASGGSRVRWSLRFTVKIALLAPMVKLLGQRRMTTIVAATRAFDDALGVEPPAAPAGAVGDAVRRAVTTMQAALPEVDAAVVRIMKARKVLSHTLLMGSIMEQLRFDCAAADIKTRIESLIDREYLERDPQNPSNYHYVA